MRNLTKALSIVLILIISFSCKKKKDEPLPPSTNSSTTGAPTIGQITSSYMYIDQVSAGGGVSVDSSSNARFSASQSSTLTVDAGTVTLNGVPFNNFSNSYSSPFSPIINIKDAQNWSVSGSGTITAFSHSFIPSYAKYTGGNLLPDTCTKSNGLTVNISGLINSPSLPLQRAPIIVQVYQGSVFMYKTINGTSGTVNFSATELAGMTTGSFMNILIGFQNYKLEQFGGNGYQFNNSVYYMKYTYLK
ncbi:MAG: hypothetical protein KA163_13070 [Bacteroidia bacterium]|nr:hypothetical protein [Bacteroidia bacterium]